jgi:hypothetical protein
MMPRNPIEPAQIDLLDLTTSVFISYRREDSSTAVQHLRESLGKLIGEDKIFRDIDSIPLGENFEKVIAEAIRGASACLVVIGPNWLKATHRGHSRLFQSQDPVRIEVEQALNAGIEVIPVLVDGAKMPSERKLPPSIRKLRKLHAQELPWQSGVAKLGQRINQIERRRQAKDVSLQAERARLDLTGGKRLGFGPGSLSFLTGIIELSLSRRGHRVSLSSADLVASISKATGKPPEQGFGWYTLMHVLDFVGVKAKTSGERYVARSYPSESLERTVEEIRLGRPVLTTVEILEKYWFEPPVSKTGFIDRVPKSMSGITFGAAVAWDPALEHLKLVLPWRDLGQHGTWTLTRKAAEGVLVWYQTRSIEPVLKPELSPES